METKPRSRFARLMLATLAGTLALGGTAATMARAETGSNDAATVQALGAAKLSLADAIRAAEGAGQGMVKGAEFEIRDGTPVFDVTTLNGSAETDHRIDPATGAILSSTPDTKNAGDESDGENNGEGDGKNTESSELAALGGAKVTLLQAIAAAEGQGGKALAAGYDQENGALAIRIELADAAGKTMDLRVDAVTGKVLATSSGSSDGEDGEGGEEQEG
ncbi:MAG: PepSY domain-containing protein [Pseudomonadota bacterium]